MRIATRTRRFALLALMASLLSYPGFNIGPSSVGAAVQTETTLWRPYGPHIDKVLIKVFADATAEFADFEAGGLDLTDTPIPSTDRLNLYLANPDLYVSSPVDGNRFVALNGWDGVVNQLGVGFPGFWSVYNMRQRLDYVPVDPMYTPGGGDPDLMRWGFSSSVNRLNIYHATSAPELRMLRLIYEPLLIVNPVDSSQVIDWMAARHEVSFNLKNDQTTLRFFLRNDVRWSDGKPVTAHDMVFTINSFRDVPAASFSPLVKDVMRAKVLRDGAVEVTLRGVSSLHERNIGRVPIIPQHIWDADGNGRADRDKVDPAFDPIIAGLLIGSGPFLCRDLATGENGGGCSFTAAGVKGGQAIGAGGAFHLTRYEGHMRDALLVTKRFINPLSLPDPSAPSTHDAIASLHAFSWADINDDLFVNVIDLANVALAFGSAHPYWDDLVYGTTPGMVDLGEVMVVASYLGSTLCGVFGSGCTGLQTADPYKVGGIFTKSVVVIALGPGSVIVSFDLFNTGGTATFTTVDVIGPFGPTSASFTIPGGLNAFLSVSGSNPPGDNFVKFKILAAGQQDLYRTPVHI